MGCSIAGIIDETGRRFTGDDIINCIAMMALRANGLGGGFAGYGIYPDHADDFCFHVMYSSEEAQAQAETRLRHDFEVRDSEPIPTRELKEITNRPLLWRYFLQVRPAIRKQFYDLSEEDIVTRAVMAINAAEFGAYIVSCGRNMGIFKGVGYAADIGRFYCLDRYAGYCWTAHDRFPTNTPGWWAGAHPFGLLDFSLVHNGEISSYGTNKRYLEEFGYVLSLRTDSEAILYLFDLLLRRHKLPVELAYKALCPPLWEEIERMPKEARELHRQIRLIYGSALINGPSAIIIGTGTQMIGFTDRVKLRPLVAARGGGRFFLASEESAIRRVCAQPETVFSPHAGELAIGGFAAKPRRARVHT